ncbi:phosphotransferase [Kribbella sp. NPDC049227]|uniref:phosphotransferase n=1 Tax=Kribbella sp. NPDC049227 TaxID=3364113 RepID=UPI00371E9C4D
MATWLRSSSSETVGCRRPRPVWVHAEDTLDQVARRMRAYHQAVADFMPPAGAVWRGGGAWSPGLIIAHNDAATYNAAWHQDKLTGFFDWDFAGPATPEWALAGFSWVPLHARHVVAAEGLPGCEWLGTSCGCRGRNGR